MSRSFMTLSCALIAGALFSSPPPAAASPRIEAAIVKLSAQVGAGFASLTSQIASLGDALGSLQQALADGLEALTDTINTRGAAVQAAILGEIDASKQSVVAELGLALGSATTTVVGKVEAVDDKVAMLDAKVGALDSKVDGLIDMIDGLEAGGGALDQVTQARVRFIEAALKQPIPAARMAERIAELESDSNIAAIDAALIRGRNSWSEGYVIGQTQDYQCFTLAQNGRQGSFLLQWVHPAGTGTFEFIVHHWNSSSIDFVPAQYTTLDETFGIQHATLPLNPGSIVLAVRFEQRYPTGVGGKDNVVMRTFVIGRDDDRCAF